MTAEATYGQRLKRAFTDNLGLKLFSLIVAIALFTVVHGSEAGQRSLYVPIVAMLPPESSGNVLVGELPDKVKVTLSGSRSVVNSIHQLDAVQIDLTSAPRTYTFEPALFGVPAGIDVQSAPAVLTLDWEPRQEAKLPVRVQLSGTPDPTLQLVGKPTVAPPRLLVKGPRSSIEAMSELPTDLLPLGGLGAGIHRVRVPLLSLPQGVSVVGTPEVTVELNLELKREQRKLRHLAVAVVGIGGTAALRPSHVDVLVAAPESTLEELDPEHVVPTVEVPADARPGLALSLPVTVRGLDDSVRLLRIEPSEVLVRVEH
ncbi:MAG TPA: CdaR family protein [Polyangiales bacterium]|nr:CdaR family protein [Polyangiales bacterium]